MPSRRCQRPPTLFGRRAAAAAATLAALLSLLTSPPLSQSIYLDVHVPLPRGCLEYHALLANRLLRQASEGRGRSSSPPPPAAPAGGTLLRQSEGGGGGDSGEEGDDENKAKVAPPSEGVNLFSDHTPHVTLYLADFDLEADVADDAKKADGHDDGIGSDARPLNQTKVAEFKNAIASLNFTEVLSGLKCPLSLSSEESPTSSYYNINGVYTMLTVRDTPCLQTLSTTLLHSLRSFLRQPIAVPSWVASLPEPSRSAAIYRSRTYGSPNVLEGFEPHVTVGYDPARDSDSDPASAKSRWREETMARWSEAYEKVRETCVDEVRGIALGRTGAGGTVLANSRMGYWELAAGGGSKVGDGKALPGDVKSMTGDYAVVE